MTLRTFVVGWFVLIAPATLAQASATSTLAAAKSLTFDVVTIKPHDPRVGPYGWILRQTPDGYSGQNISLYYMVQEAYGDDDFQRDPKLITGGPSWIDKDKFDLDARIDLAELPNAKALTYRQRADMLRAVLADRFQLKIHFETKEFPVYNLVIAKGGPRMTETKPEDLVNGPAGPACVRHPAGDFNFNIGGCQIRDLENILLFATGRTVFDKTGLIGRYDIKLRFAPLNTPENSPLADRPSILTAVQEQLGLKLEPSTALLEVLVIDSAEMPTPN